LLRILEDLPVEGGRMVCENRGTGIATMLRVMRDVGLPPPLFEDRVTTFLVVARNVTLVDPETGKWLNRIAQHTPLTEAQRLGLAYLRQTERLTNADFRRLSPRLELHRATQELAGLVRKGLLESHRARRWTFYTLTDRALAFAVEPARRRGDRREAIVNLLLERGALSAKEIARALGLELPAVRRWLRILRDEGRVVPTTARVRSRYVRYRTSEQQA
ncbi:MAG TPA: ArsR family transcriptional regulator, partial [Candidatus Acetothermia bacterium]|nr:ArsR family transcriptional regulator [Candidatus Acetothermia bacterium]